MGGDVDFKGYEQNQGQLFPSHVSEALDASDPVFFIDDFVEGLELKSFEARYSVTGERAYPPRMLLKLWLFGATEGVYSGREIARRLRWDLRFRYLAGGLTPDFRTINRFRIRHREDFAYVFRETVHTARASGMAQLGRVAIDGTKIRANTSRHKAMSHGRMDQAEVQLEAEIAEILSQLDTVNEREDDTHGDDDGAGGLPSELQNRQHRIEKLRAVRKQLEVERGETLKSSSQKSFADPDANMMMTSEGSLQYCYNGQVAASEDGVIVANGVTTSPLDVQQLVPMVDEIQATTRCKPGVVVADAGYLSEKNLKAMRKNRQRCLVAVRGRKKGRWPRGPETQRMHRLLRLPWAQKIYRTRKTQGERPFAEIKQTIRFRRFATRGRANIRGEWDLVCAAVNALTLHRAAMA
ncbi:MAG: transposase [Deltaproteobacteria bacterium]|jgi:transposase|nr:transposase [Deltaproteobacteria bacterium]MBW2499866.1 transposase [Deltaproteobacteria bacterium]